MGVLQEPFWIISEPINFVILPLVGMIIGYATNWIAIKLLFWPKKPFFGLYGVIPKRKGEIATSVAKSYLNVLPKQISELTKIPIIGAKISEYLERGVASRVRAMDNDQIQQSVENVTGKELKFIKFSGAVLGFAIGIIQAVILELI